MSSRITWTLAIGPVPMTGDLQSRVSSVSKMSPIRCSPERTSSEDVVGRGVAVPLLERVDDGLPRVVLGQHDGVAQVGADVVAGGLEPEAVALLECVPDESLGLVAADLRFLGGRTRSAEVFVVVAVALVDLDDGLDLRVVVAPVGAHARCRWCATSRCRRSASGRRRAVLGVGCARASVSSSTPTGQRPDAAARHHHVAVPVGIDDAALVGVRGDESAAVIVQVGLLLDEPPHVFVAEPVVWSPLPIQSRSAASRA